MSGLAHQLAADAEKLSTPLAASSAVSSVGVQEIEDDSSSSATVNSSRRKQPRIDTALKSAARDAYEKLAVDGMPLSPGPES
jgi:hypothetical protein